MKNLIPTVKGTRDFYPEDMAIRTWLYNMVRQVSESFGYQEYEGPMLETLDLYAAKSGDELVKEQSYVFSDRGGDLITLRPELTPSLSRMVAQRQKQLVYPLRWWSFGPFWRYERPQKGRSREFFQWNIDLLGADTPEADAEIIAILATFFRTIGLTPKDVIILVNNRLLMDKKISSLGVPADDKIRISNLIDRRKKMAEVEWEKNAAELGLNPSQLSNLKAILDNSELWREYPDLVRLLSALEAMGVSEYIRFDANIIRGLQYYTGTVFEAYDVTGDIKRSILGGGRYDNLLFDVGGEPLPAVGYALGDVIITLLLQRLGLIPTNLSKTTAQVLVTVFNEAGFPESLKLANQLRHAGINTACYPETAKLSKQLKYADRIGIPFALVIGPDELREDEVAVKNLADGSQQNVKRTSISSFIRDLNR